MSKKAPKRRLTAQVLILGTITALLAILVGKLIVGDAEHDPILYTYGIIVTSAITLLISVRYWRYQDPYLTAQPILEADPKLRRVPLVSIMVAAYNEEDFITECVSSLKKQTYLNREIIVVNDASTDNTAHMLETFRNNPDVHLIDLTQNAGKKRALAEAMLRAKGSIFVFTDSDSVLAPDAVERAVDIFNAYPEVGAVSGHTRVYNAQKNLLTRIQDTWYEGQFSIRKAYESSFGAVTCVSGPLAAFRRSTVYNLIPAWINDTFLGGEFKFATDRTKTAFVLANRQLTPIVRKKYPDSPFVTEENYQPKDWQVVYTGSAHAWTNVPETFRQLINQQIRWKKSFIRNIWLTGAYYWRKPFLAAVMYYLRALFVIIGPFIVFRHLVWLPMNGDWYTGVLYFSGVLFIGFAFATLHKVEKPEDDVWVYRPLMNLISTFVLSWLIFYSLATIRQMVWHRK